MILGDVFERFAQDSPLSVMARGVLENALNPQVVDTLFEEGLIPKCGDPEIVIR